MLALRLKYIQSSIFLYDHKIQFINFMFTNFYNDKPLILNKLFNVFKKKMIDITHNIYHSLVIDIKYTAVKYKWI